MLSSQTVDRRGKGGIVPQNMIGGHNNQRFVELPDPDS